MCWLIIIDFNFILGAGEAAEIMLDTIKLIYRRLQVLQANTPKKRTSSLELFLRWDFP